MGVLHVAVNLMRNDMIALILMSERTDVNLMSSLHGTPLHMAAILGDLKMVQQLLVHGADFTLRSQKNGKLAKDSTDNQRVVYLIEKYEKMKAIENESHSDSCASGDEDDDMVEVPGLGRRPMSQAALGSALGTALSSLAMIEEEKESEAFN